MSRYGERTRIGEAVSALGRRGAAGGVSYGVATGGTSSSITVGADTYTLLTFASDTNLVVTNGGLFDVLLIGGGGGSGGGDSSARAGGGGGSGDIVGITNTLTIYLAAGTYAVDVGAGGAGSRRGGAAYRSTIHGTMLGAIGGGGAAGYSTPPSGQEAVYAYIRYQGWNGGGNVGNFLGTFPAEFAVTAKAGGAVTGIDGAEQVTQTAGGGGGCGSVGVNGVHATYAGGAGGDGLDISGFTGAGSAYYAGAGGGGGGHIAGAAGLGGVAGVTSGAGNNGVNYGAGGGGKRGSDSGGNGAAGAVFVRFKV
jgi:hypothetical protein